MRKIIFWPWKTLLVCWILIGWITFFSGCYLQPRIIELSPENVPALFDDSNAQDMLTAAQHHLNYLKKHPEEQLILPGNRQVNAPQLVRSIRHFMEIVAKEKDPKQRSIALKKDFRIFQVTKQQHRATKGALVTGYYEPIFSGSLKPNAWFNVPIYRTPDDLVVDKKNNKNGRYDSNGVFQPYWTRAEIENQQKLAGYELAYLHDPFDAFLLQVQGSGRIQLPDKTVRTIRFAAHNGHKYLSIGRLLIDEKKLSRESVSVPTLRRYLDKHPDERRRILQYNPRVIFFSWGTEKPPVGSMNVPLTPEHSIAVDPKALPTGLVGYLSTQKPDLRADDSIAHWSSLGRFVFAQDSGAAIQGANRVDLFWGAGRYAEIAAGNMKHRGQLYFLLAK